MEILILCTGNICRSPMAEALLRARLAERAPGASVSSAGLLLTDHPADPHAVAAMARRGLDLTGHRSRVASVELVAGADLVIGMERRHVREASTLAEGVFARSFTLPELVAAAEREGPRGDRDLERWIAGLGAERTAAGYLADRHDDEVADPHGGSARQFRACADQLADLLDRLVDHAWPEPDPISAAHAAAHEPWST